MPGLWSCTLAQYWSGMRTHWCSPTGLRPGSGWDNIRRLCRTAGNPDGGLLLHLLSGYFLCYLLSDIIIKMLDSMLDIGVTC